MDLTQLSLQIRENKDKSLRLILVPGIPTSAWEDLIESLEQNTCLMDIKVQLCGPFIRDTLADDLHFNLWESLMEALLRLPRLRSFALIGSSSANNSYQQECDVLPLSSLSQVQVRSRTFTSFRLSRLLLASEDMKDFSKWIRRQTRLQDVRVLACGLYDLSKMNTATTLAFTPLLQATAMLPLLSHLEIGETFTPLAVLDADQVPLPLFQFHPSLSKLSISDFIFTDKAMAQVLDTLSAHGSDLEELALSGNMTAKVAPKLTRLLASSGSSLTAMSLRLDHLEDEEVNQELVCALSKAQKLKVFSLSSFFGSDLSQSVLEAICEMLKTQNDSLEYLYVPSSDSSFWDQVRLYLGLNAAGRKNLGMLQEETKTSKKNRDQWIEALFRVRSDMSASFYLLSANPNLLSNSPSQDEDEKVVDTPTPTICPLPVVFHKDTSHHGVSTYVLDVHGNIQNISGKCSGEKRSSSFHSTHETMAEVVRMTKRCKLQGNMASAEPTDSPSLASFFLTGSRRKLM